MKRTPEQGTRIVNLLLEYFQEERPRHFTVDCCVAATRISVDVLRHYGLRARPFPTQAVVYNPGMAEIMDARMAETLTDEEAETAIRNLPPGQGKCLMIGYCEEQRPGTYNGHLVTILGERFLLDLSIEQFNRPEHDILFRPLAMLATSGLLSGQEWAAAAYNRCQIWYHRSENEDYREGTDWTGRGRQECWNLARILIRRIDRELKR